MKPRHPYDVTRFIGLFMLFALTWAFQVCVYAASTITWRPDKAVEVVVPGGAGGGIDNTARSIQNIIQSAKLMEVPIAIVNKPGGSASVGLTYIAQQSPDGLHIAMGSSALLTNHITGKSPLYYTEITPLAQLFTESISYSVRADSAIKTGKDLLDRWKQDPAGVRVGLPSVASSNHISCALVVKALGADPKKLRTVIFNSSSEGITALLGGHIDVVAAPLANTIPHLKRGALRVVAISAPRRLAGEFAQTPTLRELGVDVVAGAYRSALGPQGMGEERVAYWDDLFSRLVATQEWTAYLKKNSWEDNYLSSKESANFLKAQYAELKEILSELGLARPVKP